MPNNVLVNRLKHLMYVRNHQYDESTYRAKTGDRKLNYIPAAINSLWRDANSLAVNFYDNHDISKMSDQTLKDLISKEEKLIAELDDEFKKLKPLNPSSNPSSQSPSNP